MKTGEKSMVELVMEDIHSTDWHNVYKIHYTARELRRLNFEKLPCLFGDIIPAAGLWTLVGTSDTGKSMLLRQLALDCAAGRPFLGWQNYAKHHRCIFVATEDDASSTSYLLQRQSQDDEYLEQLRFIFTTEDIPEVLDIQLTSAPADLVVIDAWSDVFGQDLKDSNLIRRTLNVYNALAGKYGCSICFLHHTGKRTEKLEPSKNNILSGQGYEAKMRLVIELKADNTDKQLRHLCIVKGNYLGEDYKHASYALQFNPESFTFTNTGRRVPYAELVAPPEGQYAPQPNHGFDDIHREMHKGIVKAVFSNHKQQKFAELHTALGNIYANETGEGFGRNKSQKLLAYLVEHHYIKKCGKDGAAWYELETGTLF